MRKQDRWTRENKIGGIGENKIGGLRQKQDRGRGENYIWEIGEIKIGVLGENKIWGTREQQNRRELSYSKMGGTKEHGCPPSIVVFHQRLSSYLRLSSI